MFTSMEAKCTIVSEWLSRKSNIVTNRKHLLMLFFFDARRRLLSKDTGTSSLRIEQSNMLLDLYPSLNDFIRMTMPGIPGHVHADLGYEYLSIYLAKGTSELLAQSEYHCRLAMADFRASNHRGLYALQNRLFADICLQRGRRMLNENCGPTTFSSIMALCEEGLEAARETDAIHTSKELEATWVDGLQGLTERDRVAEFDSGWETVNLAIKLLLLAAETSVRMETHSLLQRALPTSRIDSLQPRNLAIWEWVQKSKARTMSRIMGTNRKVPETTKALINSRPETKTLYDHYHKLRTDVEASKQQSKFGLRRQLDQHVDLMRADEVLVRFLDLREGSPLTISEIHQIASETSGPLVFVDWFELPRWRSEKPKMLLITVRVEQTATEAGSHAVHVDEIEPNSEVFQKWVTEHLDIADDNKFYEIMNDQNSRTGLCKTLGGAIKPLETRTKPGGILLLCPTKIMHRVPLHALELSSGKNNHAGMPEITVLIQRNPVVYTYSHSLLRANFSDRMLAKESKVSLKATFLNGIHSEYSSAHRYEIGRNSVQELAQRFSTSALLDGNATKENLNKEMTCSHLVHVHTHCGWVAWKPLAHSLELPNGPVEGDKEMLPAGEIFNKRLNLGLHMNMIACGGVITNVAAGDEVRGLVPALLYAGASSTVSTLWCVHDEHGAQFSKMFFKEWLNLLQKDQKGVDGMANQTINLAKAMQKAVLSMDPASDQALIS